MSMFVDVIKYSNIKFNLINFSSAIIYVICTMSVSDYVKVPLAIYLMFNKEKKGHSNDNSDKSRACNGLCHIYYHPILQRMP